MTRRSSAFGWQRGWWRPAGRVQSPNHGPRPPGAAVTIAIVHSISLPPGRYGGPEVAMLFTNRLDADAHPYFAALRGLRVSAHFFIRRNGAVVQFVSCDRRAWHAGASRWRGRANCNDHSVGIELEGLEGERFEDAQYRALVRVLAALRRRYPIVDVVGHEQVAPGRKHDPGTGFDWRLLRRLLRLRRAARTNAPRAARAAAGPAWPGPRHRWRGAAMAG